jgi:hypothetical protein
MVRCVHPAARGPVLNPAQQRVVDDLLALGAPRPVFAEGLDLALLTALEDGLALVARRIELSAGQPPHAPQPPQLHVNKGALSQVLACEAYHQAEAAVPFAWSVATARGVVAHKAIELAVFAPEGTPPLQLVDDVIERIAETGDDRSPRDFLRSATPVDIAELRATASQVVTAFEASFPPLDKAWRPRLEAPCRVELCGGTIVLRAKVDLALGRAVGNEARVLIVDVKTGRSWPGHLDDLRFYALCETLRSGVPPFRIATYYLDTGRWQAEDIAADVLESAVRRVVAGAARLAELRFGERTPTITPGPTCGYCRLRDACAGARDWDERREAMGVELEATA